MNKLFGLFLLALACWAPSLPANAACSGGNCFWIGGTGTVDGTSDNGKWATTSGGASCACVPATSDNVTFDGSSGGGTITVNMGGGLWTVANFTMGAFTGTIDFATNSNSLTATGSGSISLTGAATKTLNMGSGTFTLSANNAFWNCGTCANLTLNAGTSTIAFTGTGSTFGRRFTPGGKTYATVSVSSGAAPLSISGNATISTLTVAAGNTVLQNTNSTLTVTTITNIAGSSSAQTLFSSVDSSANSIALTNNWTCDWCGFSSLVFSGAGTKTATNSFDFKNNSGFTSITPPSGGGGGGGRIIGG